MVDQKTDDKEAQDSEKVYNHFLERKIILKITQLKFEVVLSLILGKESLSSEKKSNLIIF